MAPQLAVNDRVVTDDDRVGTVTAVAACPNVVTLLMDDTGEPMHQVRPESLRRAHLVRTQGGAFIHRQDCPMARRGSAMPWLWADGAPEEMVRRAIVQMGYRTCKSCVPFMPIRGSR
ncbi:hypothetical protein A5721_18760 [Mycobacterium vulneris]|nr:hypothetical protein A5721_18760 [Mycolicibacterium vulneris]